MVTDVRDHRGLPYRADSGEWVDTVAGIARESALPGRSQCLAAIDGVSRFGPWTHGCGGPAAPEPPHLTDQLVGKLSGVLIRDLSSAPDSVRTPLLL